MLHGGSLQHANLCDSVRKYSNTFTIFESLLTESHPSLPDLVWASVIFGGPRCNRRKLSNIFDGLRGTLLILFQKTSDMFGWSSAILVFWYSIIHDERKTVLILHRIIEVSGRKWPLLTFLCSSLNCFKYGKSAFLLKLFIKQTCMSRLDQKENTIRL